MKIKKENNERKKIARKRENGAKYLGSEISWRNENQRKRSVMASKRKSVAVRNDERKRKMKISGISEIMRKEIMAKASKIINNAKISVSKGGNGEMAASGSKAKYEKRNQRRKAAKSISYLNNGSK